MSVPAKKSSKTPVAPAAPAAAPAAAGNSGPPNSPAAAAPAAAGNSGPPNSPAAAAPAAAPPPRATHFYNETISKLKNSLVPNLQLQSTSLDFLNALCRGLALSVAQSTNVVMMHSSRKIINPHDLRLVVCSKLHKNKEILASSLKAIDAALEQYNISVKGDSKGEGEEKAAPMRTQHKAGLTLAVSVTSQFIKIVTNRDINCSYKVGVTALVEHLLAEIILGAGEVCSGDDKRQISPRHIRVALANSPALAAALSAFNVSLAIGGATPCIDPRLEVKPLRRASARPVGAPHRYRSGTVALRLIRHYQKRHVDFIPTTTTQRITSSITSRLLAENPVLAARGGAAAIQRVRFDRDFRPCLRAFVEQRTIEILRSAVEPLLDNGKKTMDWHTIALMAAPAGYDLGENSSDEEEVCDEEESEREVERLDSSPADEEDEDSGEEAGGLAEMIDSAEHTDSVISPATAGKLLYAAGVKRRSNGAVQASARLVNLVFERYLLLGLSGLASRNAGTMKLSDISDYAIATSGEVIVFPSEDIFHVRA